nr:unnamed protein product [Digitaria exilis]
MTPAMPRGACNGAPQLVGRPWPPPSSIYDLSSLLRSSLLSVRMRTRAVAAPRWPEHWVMRAKSRRRPRATAAAAAGFATMSSELSLPLRFRQGLPFPSGAGVNGVPLLNEIFPPNFLPYLASNPFKLPSIFSSDEMVVVAAPGPNSTAPPVTESHGDGTHLDLVEHFRESEGAVMFAEIFASSQLANSQAENQMIKTKKKSTDRRTGFFVGNTVTMQAAAKMGMDAGLLAMLEAKTTLVLILRRFAFEVAPEYAISDPELPLPSPPLALHAAAGPSPLATGVPVRAPLSSRHVLLLLLFLLVGFRL